MEYPLSIITVCFNAADVIDSTLHSVASQECRDFEYIVIDGKSTDKTIEKIKSYALPNLTLVSEKDHGIYDAMNKGLKIAKGKFIVFLNAGDSFYDTQVTKSVIEQISLNLHTDIIYGQTVIVNKSGQILGPRHLNAPKSLSFDSFKNGMTVCHQAFFARRELAPEYDTRYRFSADFDWCIKIIKKSCNNIYIGDKPIVKFLDEGTTTANHKKSLMERFHIMRLNYGFVPTFLRHIKFLIRDFNRKFKRK